MVELEDEAQLAVAELRQSPAVQGRYIHTVDHERPRIRGRQCTQNLEKGRLTRTGRTHYGYDLSFRDIHVDTFQHLQRTERLFYSFSLYHILWYREHFSFKTALDTPKF